MKRLFIYLFLVLLPSSAIGQGTPVWYDSGMREMKYPADAYFTGFSIGEAEPGESRDAAIKRILNEAKVEAASNIRTSISKVMSSTAGSIFTAGDKGISEAATEEFYSSTVMHTGIKDIPGLQSEVWTDPKKGIIAAFAYVSRTELLRKVDRRLTVSMTKLELAVEDIQRLMEGSRLKEASEALDASLQLFADIEDDQKLLISIDEQYSDEDLQIERFNELKKSVSGIMESLKDGVAVFLSCSAEISGNAYPDFEKEIRASLTKLQCHFVDSAEDAERVIVLNAASVEHSKSEVYSFKTYFCYVNVDIRTENPVKGINLYEGRISQKGSHTNGFDEAAVNGYKEILGKVVQIIEENLL